MKKIFLQHLSSKKVKDKLKFDSIIRGSWQQAFIHDDLCNPRNAAMKSAGYMRIIILANVDEVTDKQE